MSATITRLAFPRPFVGSSRWRGGRSSTERSLAGESICTRRVQARIWRARLIAVENHHGEYRALYICCTCPHSSMIPFAMSLDRDEGVSSARLRVNRMEAFERPTSSKASKVVVTKTKMASRGVVGKSQLWCRKLDTRTSRYESSVGTRVCWGWSPGSDRGPSSGWV